MSTISMADLLAKSETKNLKLERNQEIQGEIISIGDSEIILDLGSKAEGVLSKKDFSEDAVSALKVGDKISSFVIRTENESGQVVLGLNRPVSTGKSGGHSKNWDKFISAKNRSQVMQGKALELNKGGLIVEVEGVRGFLPSSQVTLSQASKIDELVGQDMQVTVIEVDPGQNRLIFSQKTTVSEETKKKLSQIKPGEKMKGVVSAILPFGVFVTLENPARNALARNASHNDASGSHSDAGGNIEGLIHISELSWEKVEDPGTVVKAAQELEGVVASVDLNTGRVNLSLKQATVDPFTEAAKKFQPEDVISGTVTKVSSIGVSLELEPARNALPEAAASLQAGSHSAAGGGGVEGLIHTSKMEADMDYPIGKKLTCLVDSIDSQKRRINLVPFVTSTKDLIYK